MLEMMGQDHTALTLQNPLKTAEAAWLSDVTRMIEAGRKIRDAWEERLFETAFGDGLSTPAPARKHPDRDA